MKLNYKVSFWYDFALIMFGTQFGCSLYTHGVVRACSIFMAVVGFVWGIYLYTTGKDIVPKV